MAAQLIDINAILLANLHSIKTGRLAADCMHTGGSDLDVLAIAEQAAKKTFRDRTATNVTSANKEDAFHDLRRASVRVSNVRLKLAKSTQRRE